MTGPAPAPRAALAWPTADTAAAYFATLARLSVLFALVYAGAGLLTARYGGPRIHFDWELGLPLVPAAVYVYLSIAALFSLPLFTLDPAAIRALEKPFAAVTLIAGGVFLLVNAQPGFERAVLADSPLLLRLLHAVDPPGNLLPSLHVALAVLVARAVSLGARSRALTLVLCLWVVALGAVDAADAPASRGGRGDRRVAGRRRVPPAPAGLAAFRRGVPRRPGQLCTQGKPATFQPPTVARCPAASLPPSKPSSTLIAFA